MLHLVTVSKLPDSLPLTLKRGSRYFLKLHFVLLQGIMVTNMSHSLGCHDNLAENQLRTLESPASLK